MGGIKWDEKILKEMPSSSPPILHGDGRIYEYAHDMGYIGKPDALVRPQDLKELKDVVLYCLAKKIPITACGSRTALTGSGVASRGVMLSMEYIDQKFEIGHDPETKKPVAKGSPGLILQDFQKRIDEAAYFYPPDPTSRGEAQLGGTVATNATGADSLLYGPTRSYIRELKVLMADGTEKTFRRSLKSHPPHEKNRAGYLLNEEPIDLFIGSEGTLGIMTEITCDLLPRSPDHFSGFLFFPNLSSAISFVVHVRQRKDVTPRTLELFDQKSLKIIGEHPKSSAVPERARAAIYFKQEYHDEKDREEKMSQWLSTQENFLKKEERGLVDAGWVATDEAKNNLFRQFRHFVPETINVELVSLMLKGGGKTSTDWWVPWKNLEEMMAYAIRESEDLKLDYYIYGHIGDGHPHINHIYKNISEKEKAFECVTRMCQRAVKLGGGVAGEHGIGKLYRNLLKVQHPATVIKKMLEIKKRLDPHGLLNPDTLFPA